MGSEYLEKIFKNLVDNKITTTGVTKVPRVVAPRDLEIFNYLPEDNLKAIAEDKSLYKGAESLYLFYDRVERAGKLSFNPYSDGNRLVLNHNCAVVYDSKNKFTLRYHNDMVRETTPFELIEDDKLDAETLYMLLAFMCCDVSQFRYMLYKDASLISAYVQKIAGRTDKEFTRDGIFSHIKKSSFDELCPSTEKWRIAASPSTDYARWYLSEDSRQSIVVYPDSFGVSAYEIYLPDSQIVSMIRTLFLLSVIGIKVGRYSITPWVSVAKRMPAIGFREIYTMNGSKEFIRIFEMY